MKKTFCFILSILAVSSLCSKGQDYSAIESAIDSYDYKSAVSLIDSALSDTTLAQPSIRELNLQKAKCLKKLFRYNAAAETLASILQYDDMEVMAELADCHSQAGRYPEAMILYSQLSRMRPDNLYYKVQKAAMEYRSEDYINCIGTGKDICKTDTIPTIFTLIAGSYNQLNQLDSALAYYGKALQVNPYNRGTVTSMSNIYLQKKDYDSVISLTSSYLEEMEDWVVNPILGLAQYLKGDYKSSYDTYYRQIKEGGDESYSTLYNMGLANLALGQTGYAEEYFTKAWQTDSSDVNLAYNLGMSKVRGNTPTSMNALEYFDKALKMMEPDSTMMYKILSGRALSYYKKMDFRKAIPDYLKAYEYNPSYISALSTIAYCHEMLKEYKKAEEYYEKYLKFAKEGTENYNFAKKGLEYVKGQLFMEETE